jgi:RNA polymerase sigma factor (TIGR02999 family)
MIRYMLLISCYDSFTNDSRVSVVGWTNQMTSSPEDVTQLLLEWSNGNQAALGKLMPLVYQELHRLAHQYMARERPEHTLQTSALLNEAYLRLVDQKSVQWQNRAQFFGIAAKLMRQILIDHARQRHRAKRGGAAHQIPLDESVIVSPERAAEMVALDEAIESLATVDQRKSQILELRFFGGLSIEETAEVLEVSPGTVIRDWTLAKAWLQIEMTRDN